jgi:hypothetical protein
MQSYQMEGIIKRVGDMKQITPTFFIKEFILNVPGKYPQDIRFELANKIKDDVTVNDVGQNVMVHFSIRGKGYAKGYFNKLLAWKIDYNIQREGL